MVLNLKRAASSSSSEDDDEEEVDAKCSKRSKLYSDDASPPPWTVTVRDTMEFEPTPIFDTFWRLAAERHAIDERRRSGHPPPWTTDPILQNHKFCNTFRVLDRVSQFIVTEVIEKGAQKLEEVTFRVLLFSTYTNVRTYETLRKKIQPFTWEAYDRAKYEKVLRQLYDKGIAIYTGAYQKPAPELGFAEAFMNHLALLEVLMHDLPRELRKAKYLADVFGYLRSFKSIGDFTAYQLLLNLSYSNVMNFSEFDFVVIGIGSRRGLQRCFGKKIPPSAEVDLVRWMQITQEQHFERLGITFNGLGPDHLAMMLCDIEHTLCELDKYVRRCSNKTKNRPFEASGKLGKMRLPKAWSHKSRRILRIKCVEEAEAEVVEKFIVESIEGHREVDGSREFLATWEPEDSLMEDAPSMVKDYLKRIKGEAYSNLITVH
ncbi:hypothetical protein BU15DRAFT_84772 [Melanogaster broomeanus]|nr:hypothetical protein BU15DRAFT_84772 [Melanogaster broomeanus]